jgi:hypothetical protein
VLRVRGVNIGKISKTCASDSGRLPISRAAYSDVQKSVPVKLARLLQYISIGCCFDSHPRIDNVLQKYGFRYGLLENAIVSKTELRIKRQNQ